MTSLHSFNYLSHDRRPTILYDHICILTVDVDVDGQSFSPIGLHKEDAASDCSLRKDCREYSNKINRIT
jgi:hypothetical protein